MNKVINLSGKMSILGVTKLSDKVIEKMAVASRNFYLIDSLRREVELNISNKFSGKNAFITSSATAGIASVVMIIKKKLENKNEKRKVKVILPFNHHINYGAPIKKILELGGANVISIGTKDGFTKKDILDSLELKPDLAFFVSSHYVKGESEIKIDDYQKFYKQNNVPTGIDIAAEENIWKFIDYNFDYTVVSGSKAISAPTSGIIFIPKNDKELFYLNLHEEGRAFKISKENIIGLDQAVQEYSLDKNSTNDIDIHKYINAINKNTIFKASINKDVKRNISRILISGSKKQIINLLSLLHKNNIYCREYMKDDGKIEFDLRQTSNKEMEEVIQMILGGKYD